MVDLSELIILFFFSFFSGCSCGIYLNLMWLGIIHIVLSKTDLLLIPAFAYAYAMMQCVYALNMWNTLQIYFLACSDGVIY